MTRYFIDMDGTLAVYPSKEDRWWEVKGIFKFLVPQDKVVKAVKKLISSGREVFILSAYDKNKPEIKADKDAWLDKYLPEINTEHRIYTYYGEKKADFIPGGIAASDVLLDDYNDNLESWVKEGGVGIKLLNGINSKKSWAAVSVRANGTIKEIVETLSSIDSDLR